MMMARDSTPQHPRLDPASVEALASALLGYLHEKQESGALRDVLRDVASEARAKQMHAEQLLLALKDVWYALPPIRQMTEGEEQKKLLQRVVTLCIREYYAA